VVYSTAYSYCSSSQSDIVGFYKRLSAFLEHRVQEVLQRARALSPEDDLLQFYVKEWEVYSRSASKFNNILKSLDKFISIKLPSQLSVQELCWFTWASGFMTPFADPLLAAFRRVLTDGQTDPPPSEGDEAASSNREVETIKKIVRSLKVLKIGQSELKNEYQVDLSKYWKAVSV